MTGETTESDTYWESRYRDHQDIWDLGQPAPALLDWLRDNPALGRRVMVPGCGRGHDVLALAAAGFEVTGVDFAPSAIAAARELARALPGPPRFVEGDVFAWGAAHEASVEVVFEHTCFCTFPPERRLGYRDLLSRVLKPRGVLVGVFFTFEDEGTGPPFPIAAEELEQLLAPDFERMAWSPILNSVARRVGDEHFGVFRRK